jgi:outer membrane protein TolC
LFADSLNDVLSSNKEILFDYQFESNELESDKVSKSWINPIRLEYKKNYTTQFGDAVDTSTFSVSINQPIFRSGGIYYAIQYAEALRHANKSNIKLQRRKLIGDAVSILFNLQKTKLEQQKIKFLVKNDKIDIKQKQESYESGLLDSSFLDQAILKKSKDEANLLQSEIRLLELKQRFSLLSDKNPDSFTLPILKPVSKEEYKKKNLELQTDKLKAKVSKYQEKITTSKYLPTVSVQGQYINGDINPLFSRSGTTLREQYYTYGLSISMPIDINSLADIESSKVDKLRAAVQVIDKKESIEKEYKWITRSLHFIEKKIRLAKRDEKVYQNLYKVTKNLQKVGEKTEFDTAIMRHSLEVRKLDKKIYEIDKQMYLLKLYMRMENEL